MTFIDLHGPTGQDISVNVAEIVSMRTPLVKDHWARDAHCILLLSNGKVIAVLEDCKRVKEKLK